MGSLSIWHWIIVLVVVLLLFGGRGKVSQIMGDFGKGLKAFKRSMKDDEAFDEPGPPAAPKALPPEQTRAADSEARRDSVARP
ncbi:MAG: twin-arginine translocase TatA/TatE family subunit [Rhodospirillales bacterium]